VCSARCIEIPVGADTEVHLLVEGILVEGVVQAKDRVGRTHGNLLGGPATGHAADAGGGRRIDACLTGHATVSPRCMRFHQFISYRPLLHWSGQARDQKVLPRGE